MEDAGTDGSGPSFALPSHWFWWEDGAHDGATNMATDEALRGLARPGVAVALVFLGTPDRLIWTPRTGARAVFP